MEKTYKVYARKYKKKDGSLGKQLFITIPANVATSKEIKEGSLVLWKLDSVGNWMLKPKVEVF